MRWFLRSNLGWAIGIILALTVVALLGVALWVVLGVYINPRTATDRKDLVQSFAIVVAGVVGSLSALAAVGNLYFSRRNLQQQRELEWQRSQEDALPRYLDQMVQLLNDKDRPLRQAKGSDEVSILARVRTLTVLPRLDGSRKASVMQFLYEAGLIRKEHTLLNESGLVERRRNIISLEQADLIRADLSRANLREADLSRANLREADLSGANLRGANLSGADLREANLRLPNLIRADLSGANLIRADLGEAILSGANLSIADLRGANLSGAVLIRAFLSGADLSGANLIRANLGGANLSSVQGWSEDQLRGAWTLEGATMPNGQKYEDWLRDKEAQGKDEKNE